MLAASCFITPHLLAAFILLEKCLLKLERRIITDSWGYTTTQRLSEKKWESSSMADAKPLACLAPNPAGSILCCPPLPICQSVNRWGLTVGLVGTHPWPLYERLTKQEEPNPFGCWEKGTSWETDKTSPLLLITCQTFKRFRYHSAGLGQNPLLRRNAIKVAALSILQYFQQVLLW